jgi:hypothetical protein
MDEDTKEYAFRIYLAQYSNMDKKTYISFNEFWDNIKPKKAVLDTRNKDDIMQDILELEKSFGKGETHGTV